MTIEEFMRDIAPKMRPGWIAMDESGRWYWYSGEPYLSNQMNKYIPKQFKDECCSLLSFAISPVDDWRKSLRKVGN